MAFYEFLQNNSGGSFDHDRDAGIGYRVWIEANNADQANDLAEGIGLYFDGCDTGMDCDCCGDRWYPQWDDGEEYPAIDSRWDFKWHKEVYLHPLEGSFVVAGKDNYQEVLSQFIPDNLGHA